MTIRAQASRQSKSARLLHVLGDYDRMLVVMHDNWVSFKTPEKTVLSILEDAFGRQGADQVMETFWDCIARQEINVLRYRADLSYVPSR